MIMCMGVYVNMVCSVLKEQRRWNTAGRVYATVVETIGEARMATGSQSVGSTRYRKFGHYRVQIWQDEATVVREAEYKVCGLVPGEQLELRVQQGENEEMILLSEATLHWKREMVIGWTFIILAGIGSILATSCGIL